MPELLASFATALVAFLVIIDPLGLVPIFIALTRNADPEQRQRMALKAVVVAACVLVAFALVGENLLRSIGIGIPAFRIAGGILLLLVALEMVFERRSQRRENTADHLADERTEGHPVADISVFPMAVPLLAGPGAITTVILHMGSRAGSWPHQAAVMAALLVTLLVVAISLFLASRLGRFLGPTLISVFSRLLGLLLSALAVQFIIDGIKRAFGI